MATKVSCDFCGEIYDGHNPAGGKGVKVRSISLSIEGRNVLYKDVCSNCVEKTGWKIGALPEPYQNSHDQLFDLLMAIIDEAVDSRT